MRERARLTPFGATQIPALSGFGAAIRTLPQMATRTRRALGVAAFALTALLALAPTALAASAVDQYQEGFPTAGGQEPSRDAVGGSGGTRGTETIPPQTRAQLNKSKKGSAAEKAAKITAPSRPGSGPSDAGGGMGFLLPLILVAALAGAVAIFVARRRAGPPPDQPGAGTAPS